LGFVDVVLNNPNPSQQRRDIPNRKPSFIKGEVTQPLPRVGEASSDNPNPSQLEERRDDENENGTCIPENGQRKVLETFKDTGLAEKQDQFIEDGNHVPSNPTSSLSEKRGNIPKDGIIIPSSPKGLTRP